MRKPSRKPREPLALIAGCILAGVATPVSAETLADAIAVAYQTNPVLQSERAQLRAIDEDYVQARAGFGPTAQVQVTGQYVNTKLGKSAFDGERTSGVTPPAFNEQNTGDAELVVQQTLYSGGRTTAEVRSAEARIRAARAALRATEGNVFLGVIQAYEDVLRDQQSLTVRGSSVKALADQLAEITARQRAGEVTQTDVAQAEAQLAAERALFASAQGQLQLSRIEYATTVGQNPGELAPAPELPNQPATPDQAFDVATATSPDLLQALYAEIQSRQAIVAARAANRPTVSLQASYGYTGGLEPFYVRDFDRAFSGEAVVTQPIFTSGLNGSLIRQAVEQNTSDRVSIETARRAMVQNVANAWNERLTADANVAAQLVQVAAAQKAFTGMRIEYRAGQRSTLDVLVAEETLRDAQLALIAARHDAYLGTASVLRYVGRLEASSLMVGMPEYDPTEHFRRVAHAGSTPWEPIVRSIDALAAPAAGQRGIVAPSVLESPEVASTPLPAVDGNLIVDVPVTPITGTTSPSRH